MSSNTEVYKNPWAAIAAGVMVIGIVGMQYLTFTALEAQSDAIAQIMNASDTARRMEITGLRTRQQIILTEVRQLNEAAANAHQAPEEATEADANATGADADADADEANAEPAAARAPARARPPARAPAPAPAPAPEPAEGE
ncbi:MAG: hypothetical protein JRH11_23115 [Deltaproteobacteria bacterium]|nr:hypothetical protein [Deltaproteobacteria bacterium]